MPSRIALTFLTSFLLAIFALQWWQLPSYPLSLWILLGFFGFLGFAGLGVVRFSGRRRVGFFIRTHEWVRFMIPLALALALALFTVARTMHVPTPATVDWYADGQWVQIEGIIVEEPDRRPTVAYYTIDASSLTTASGGVIPVTGRVRLTDFRTWPPYAYGDRVIARGRLEKPGIWEAFHFDRYLSLRSIYSVVTAARITLKEADASGSWILKVLYASKDRFEARINRVLPEPHASLLAGLLTGSRRDIPKALLEDFNATGLTHIIAISGYNITIILGLLAGLLFWLPLRWRFVPSVAAIVLFTLFVGASASVVRAAIMGILGLLALQAGRQRHALAILWTLFLMLFWNPKQLWYDAGFQLSFLAVIGVTFVAPLLERSGRFLPRALWIRDTLFMTIAAQLFAIPWVAVLFGRLSLLGPVANILVAPLVPLAMLLGFLGTVVSILWFTPGLLISYLTWGCLELIIRIAEFFADVPYASLSNVRVSMTIVALYYMVLGLVLLWVHRRNNGME